MKRFSKFWAEYATQSEAKAGLRDGLLDEFMAGYDEGVEEYVRLAEAVDTPSCEITAAVKRFDANLSDVIRATTTCATELCAGVDAMFDRANAKEAST